MTEYVPRERPVFLPEKTLQLRKSVFEFVNSAPAHLSFEQQKEIISSDFAHATEPEWYPTSAVTFALNKLEEDHMIARWIYVPMSHPLDSMKVDVILITRDNRIIPIQIGSYSKGAEKKRIIESTYGLFAIYIALATEEGRRTHWENIMEKLFQETLDTRWGFPFTTDPQ